VGLDREEVRYPTRARAQREGAAADRDGGDLVGIWRFGRDLDVEIGTSGLVGKKTRTFLQKDGRFT
jgi:hypothetical protein